MNHLLSKLKIQFCILCLFLYSGFSLAQVKSDSTLYNYCKSLVALNEKKLNLETENAIHAFLSTQSDQTRAAELQMDLADYFMMRKKYDRAYVAYTKAVTLYPESPETTRGTERAKEAVSKSVNLSPIKEKLYAIVEKPPQSSQRADTHFLLLKIFHDLVYPKLNGALIPEYELFLEAHSQHKVAIQVAEWIGDMHAQNKDHWQAVAVYLRVIHQFDDPSAILRCHIKTADLFAQRLKKYGEAVGVYQLVVKQQGDTVAASEAQYKLAEIYDRKLNNPSRAVEEYQILVDQYPMSQWNTDAMLRRAELQVSKLKQYEGGIATYRAVTSQYPTHEKAGEALILAGEVYEKKMKDYTNAVTTYGQVAELYPTHIKAPDVLFKAGELAEKKLKDNGMAVTIYEKVLDQFPSHKVAKRAKKKIDSLKTGNGR